MSWPSDSPAGTQLSRSSFSADDSVSKFNCGHEAPGWGEEEARTKSTPNLVYHGAPYLGHEMGTSAQFSRAVVFPPIV